MPSPFPGMNPYLEHPALWSGVHHRLITAIADEITPQIEPKYIVSIEERVYQLTGEESLLVGVPDVSVQQANTANLNQSNIALAVKTSQPIEVMVPLLEILTESYLEIRSVETGEVITAIEILSPKNKSVTGRVQYESKRQIIFASNTHLVEIDLLRQGKPMPLVSPNVQSDYRILVSRSDTRPKAELYVFNLKDKIPIFPVPLQIEDQEAIVDLQKLIDEIYDRGRYGFRFDYQRNPFPSVSATDEDWIDTILKQQGLR